MDSSAENAWFNRAAAARLSTPHETVRLTVAGLRREYVLHKPAGWDGSEPLPLVVMFHGGGGSARVSIYATGWSEKADAERFVVVYPQATRKDMSQPPTFLRNPPFWNVGSGMGHAERAGIDDVAYAAAVLDDLHARNAVDPRRVYLCGFSNGAAMALRSATALSERVAAVGAIAGHLWRREAPPARPVPLLYMSGGLDPIVPPGGGDVTSPWGRGHRLPPVSQTVETWARWCGCAVEPTALRDDTDVRQLRYSPSATGAAVEHWTIHDAGHVWPGGPNVLSEKISGPGSSAINATDALWDFFRAAVVG